MTRGGGAVGVGGEPIKVNPQGKLSTVGLHNTSPAAVLRHALAEVDPPLIDGVLYTHGDPDWDDAIARSAALCEDQTPAEPAAVERPNFRKGEGDRSWIGVSPSRLAQGGAVRVDDLLGLSPTQGRERGLAVHEAFERITYADEADRATLPEDVGDRLDQPAVRDTLTRQHPDEVLWRERPFAARVDGRLLTGRFDRVVIEPGENGRAARARLIDFKTDRHTPEAVERYRPQMQAYRAALAALLEMDASAIEAVLLFVGDGVAEHV